MRKKSQEVDDTLFLGVITAITLALLLWAGIVIHDTQKDVKEIKTTVDTMHKTLTKLARFQIDTDISAESE